MNIPSYPLHFASENKTKQAYQPTNIFHTFFASRTHTSREINQTNTINPSLCVCLGRMPGVHTSVHPCNNY